MDLPLTRQRETFQMFFWNLLECISAHSESKIIFLFCVNAMMMETSIKKIVLITDKNLRNSTKSISMQNLGRGLNKNFFWWTEKPTSPSCGCLKKILEMVLKDLTIVPWEQKATLEDTSLKSIWWCVWKQESTITVIMQKWPQVNGNSR